MAARSIGSATIRLAHVAIPVKYFTAVSEQRVSFNQLHRLKTGARKKTPCGSRLKQVLRCAAEGVEIEREEIVLGYEYQRDKWVMFTDEDLAQLELDADTNIIQLSECVPFESVPLTHLKKTLFLGPDKGASRPYRLLANALERASAVAVGQIGGRTRDDLVIVRPFEGGLALHEAFYSKEVRSFAELEIEETDTLSPAEISLADTLIDQLLEQRFDAARFTDEAAARVAELVARKVEGKEIVVPPPAKGGEKVLDLLEQLEKSVAGPSVRKARSGHGARERRVTS